MRQEILMISRLSMPCLLVWTTIRQSVIRPALFLRTTNTFLNATAPGHSPRRHRRTSGLIVEDGRSRRSGFPAQIGVRFYLIYFLTSSGYPKSSSLRITSKFSG